MNLLKGDIGKKELRKKKNFSECFGITNKKKFPASKKRSLLFLDNATRLIEEDKENFKKFLTDLHDECPNLKVIVTSRCGLDMRFDSF